MKKIRKQIMTFTDKILNDDMEYNIYGKYELKDELETIKTMDEVKNYLNALKKQCDLLAEEEEDNSYLNIKREIENYEKTLKVWLKTLQI